MLVSDVNIETIYKLLKSVPAGMEIHSIDLTDGYTLKLTAGTKEVDKIDYDMSLEQLQKIIKEYDRNTKRLQK